MGQTTIVLMLITILSKILGFVRESVMAAYIGAGELKSIYTTANTIPLVISNIIASGIVSGFIPMYNKAKNELGESGAKEFTNDLLNILLLIGTASLLIIFIFARPITKLLSPDLDGPLLDLATNYTRIIMFVVHAFLYSAVIKGYLNLKGNFIDPVITGIILNIFIIFATILTSKYKNPYILIIGALLGNVLQYFRYPIVAKKLGYKYKMSLNYRNSYIKYMMLLSVPIIISSAAGEISIIVDNAMGSAFFGKDSVSKIFYAKTMLGFILGVVTMSVTTVTFPEIARLGQLGEIDSMKIKVDSALILSLVLVVPSTVGMMTLSNPIIELAFERNAFTSTDTIIVASLMTSYAPYVIFWTITKILANSFYSVGTSKIPVIIILLQQFINFILNFILINFFDIDGLAYATTISTAIGSLIMLIMFHRQFGKINFKRGLISSLKITIATVIMGISSFLLYSYFIKKTTLSLCLIMTVVISACIYVLCIYFSKIDEIEDMKSLLRIKMGGFINGFRDR